MQGLHQQAPPSLVVSRVVSSPQQYPDPRLERAAGGDLAGRHPLQRNPLRLQPFPALSASPEQRLQVELVPLPPQLGVGARRRRSLARARFSLHALQHRRPRRAKRLVQLVQEPFGDLRVVEDRVQEPGRQTRRGRTSGGLHLVEVYSVDLVGIHERHLEKASAMKVVGEVGHQRELGEALGEDSLREDRRRELLLSVRLVEAEQVAVEPEELGRQAFRSRLEGAGIGRHARHLVHEPLQGLEQGVLHLFRGFPSRGLEKSFRRLLDSRVKKVSRPDPPGPQTPDGGLQHPMHSVLSEGLQDRTAALFELGLGGPPALARALLPLPRAEPFRAFLSGPESFGSAKRLAEVRACRRSFRNPLVSRPRRRSSPRSTKARTVGR